MSEAEAAQKHENYLRLRTETLSRILGIADCWPGIIGAESAMEQIKKMANELDAQLKELEERL